MKKKITSVIAATITTLNLLTWNASASTNNVIWNNVKKDFDTFGDLLVEEVYKTTSTEKSIKSQETVKISSNNEYKIYKNINPLEKKDLSSTKIKHFDLNAKDINTIYKTAYEATIYALTEKKQGSINIARKAISRLPKEYHWAIGEFSKQVDTVQHPIFVEIVDLIELSRKSKSQEHINAARGLVIEVIEDEYKKPWSSALDEVQQKLIVELVDSVNNLRLDGNSSLDIRYTNTLINEIKTVEFNDGVKNWISTYENEFNTNLSETEKLSMEYKNNIKTKLDEQFVDIQKLTSYNEIYKLDREVINNIGKYWASHWFNIIK